MKQETKAAPVSDDTRLWVLGWDTRVLYGPKLWTSEDHKPEKTTGVLWYQDGTLTSTLPEGQRLMDGYVRTVEKKLPNGKLATVVTAHYRERSIGDTEFGFLSCCAWLLRQNGVTPKGKQVKLK